MKPKELNFSASRLHYDGIIGTGGIGSGSFFVVNGDHTLGREESRSGHFLDTRDYCKLHIILHYVKVLLGPTFKVIPVGKVGNDDVGQKLVNEMTETGFVMKRIGKELKSSTLFSFCFYYPDGSGGNLTTDNSASSMVDSGYIEEAMPDIESLGSRGIIIAAPEVPVAARKKLIELGKQNSMFCTASFTTGEIPEMLTIGIIDKIDLISINLDEAAAVAGIDHESCNEATIVNMAIEKLMMLNRNIMISVTAGKEGSWCWNGAYLTRFPSIKADAVGTAGAGDAFFSGLIAGIAIGLSLSESQQLASLVAGLSVCSNDTIHKGIDRHSLKLFMLDSGMNFSEPVVKLLEEY